MKLNFVVQAYGPQAVGGAEWACRQLATGISQRGHEVRVLTTCATESATWRNELAPGISHDGKVEVLRFPTVAERHPDMDAISDTLFKSHAPTLEQQRNWIEIQGPLAPDLITAIRDSASQPDLWIFYTYLYYPTVIGLPSVADKALLHPALHDEPPAHLPIIKSAVRAAKALSVQTPEEWALILRLMGWAPWKVNEVGMGVAEGHGDGGAFRDSFGLQTDPFVLYLGRVDKGKGSDLLVSYFAAYKKERPSNLKLVVAGHVFDEPTPHSDLIITGPISEEQKWAALQECEVFIHPSFYESFGISLVESWLKRRPALVNANSAVTAGHATRSQGALSFSNYPEFSGALEVLMSDSAARSLLGQNGWAYAQRYLWDQVLDRYENFLGSLTD